jgi:hypothetical protein
VLDVHVDVEGRVFAVGAVERRFVTIDEWWNGEWADADVAIQRFGPDGHRVWTKILADPGVKDRDSGLAIDSVGGTVVIAGLDGGSRDAGRRAWLARIAPRGHLVWSTRAGAQPSFASDVALTPWSDVQVVGRIGARPRRLFLRGYSLDGAPSLGDTLIEPVPRDSTCPVSPLSTWSADGRSGVSRSCESDAESGGRVT